jgi:hypothetical protein
MFAARILVVLVLTFTVVGAFGCDGVAFADLSPSHRSGGTPAAIGSGIGAPSPPPPHHHHHSVPMRVGVMVCVAQAW